jgi:hypothetical protein
MKKLLLVLGLVATMGVCSAYPSERVSQKVLTSFKTEFTNAQNVEWETGNNYFRASFTMNEQRIFAYYNVNGELLSIARIYQLISATCQSFHRYKK